MNKLNALVDSHKFFVKESFRFANDRSSFAYYAYYPIAYIKFMWYTFKNS